MHTALTSVAAFGSAPSSSSLLKISTLLAWAAYTRTVLPYYRQATINQRPVSYMQHKLTQMHNELT